MACFLVPAAEAAIVTALEKGVEKKDKHEHNEEELNNTSEMRAEVKIPLSQKLRWLSSMLLGGSTLLAFEHVWHGEVAPWFPFLTAMGNPEDAVEMFQEMATVGVGMTVLVTAVWFGVCKVADVIVKRPLQSKTEKVKVR